MSSGRDAARARGREPTLSLTTTVTVTFASSPGDHRHHRGRLIVGGWSVSGSCVVDRADRICHQVVGVARAGGAQHRWAYRIVRPHSRAGRARPSPSLLLRARRGRRRLGRRQRRCSFPGSSSILRGACCRARRSRTMSGRAVGAGVGDRRGQREDFADRHARGRRSRLECDVRGRIGATFEPDGHRSEGVSAVQRSGSSSVVERVAVHGDPAIEIELMPESAPLGRRLVHRQTQARSGGSARVRHALTGRASCTKSPNQL